MALTVSNAPNYSGTLAVGSGSTATLNGPLQGSNVQIQGSGTPAYNTGAVLGATSINTPAGPSAAEIAEGRRVANVRAAGMVKRGGIESGAQTSLVDNRNTFANDSEGFVNGIRQGQNTINSGRTNNALNLRRSMAAIASGVRQGMRSGGVDLANMNALDSGASDALSRAWARAGGGQAAGANNEAQLKDNELNTTQQNLDLQENQGLGKLRTWRQTETARVSNKLWNDLQTLEAEAGADGAGGIVDLGVRDRLINQSAAELDAIDRATQAALNEIRGLTPQEIAAQAFQMEQAGAEVANPFAVEGVDQGKQMGGAPIGQFNTAPRSRHDETPAYNPFTLRQDDQQVAVA